MLFNSLSYLFFFPAVLLLYWIAPHRFRMPLLIVASYVFYMSWKPVYGVLLFALTLFNFSIAFKLSGPPSARKGWLAAAIAVNLLTLGYFKYALFAKDVLMQTSAAAGLHIHDIALNIVLPLGISFFVFEFIHYLVDVYRGNAPVSSFAKFTLFASFFPTQIAGPIKRYEEFNPQIDEPKKLSIESFDEGFSLIVYGLFKKVILADTLAVVSQTVFPHPEFLTNIDCWLGVYAFAFQIYFDFSGYTDIARGSAKLLGFDIPINFNSPYMAQSVTDFWHRWHISLSTWLRDYLFIPLGGSRKGWTATCRNLLVTMILGGLWHGASMHFVAWGAFQGTLLVLHRLWCTLLKPLHENNPLQRLRQSVAYKFVATIATFHVLCLGWVLFRADDMRLASMIMQKVLFLEPLSKQTSLLAVSLPTLGSHLIFPFLIPTLVLLSLCHYLCSKPAWTARIIAFAASRPLVNAACLAAAICALFIFSPETTPKFIYFQF